MNYHYLTMDNNEITLAEDIKSSMIEDRKERKRNRLLLTILIILLLLLPLFIVLYNLQVRTRVIGKAAGLSGRDIEIENSYMFASPLKARVGGEKIRVTVFVLNSIGKGVFGKTVVLGENPALEVTTISGVTDELGRAIFDISASSRGLYLLESSVDGMKLKQRVAITFE